MLPLARLFSPGHSFHAWLDQICQVRNEDPEEQGELRESLRNAYESFIKPIEEYRFPVVELSA